MIRKLLPVVGGAALGAGLLLGPLAASAGAQTSTSQIKSSDVCEVIPLPLPAPFNTLTLCVPVP